MTATNRFLNRLILLIVGVAALATAGLCALRLVPDVASTAAAALEPWTDGITAVDPTLVLWAIVIATAVVVALCAAWIATRGRGRTSKAVAADDIVVDDTVVAGILRRRLGDAPDVLAVSAQGYRRAGGVVLVRVETRNRANLPALLTRLRSAVAETDLTIGTPVPLVIHLTTGIRTAVSGSRITQ